MAVGVMAVGDVALDMMANTKASVRKPLVGAWVAGWLLIGLPSVGASQTSTGTTARRPAVSSATATQRKAVADSEAVARAFLEADAQVALTKLAVDRRAYLKRASWAELGDRCNPGSLRVFSADTTTAQQDSVQKLVERLESTLIARGVGAPLATPEARSLLRVIVGWEAGIDRPRWDSDEQASRMAVAAGLTGEVPDPRGDTCLASPMVSDTVTFVVPGFPSMEFPKAPSPRVKAYFGAAGQQRARDEFYATRGNADPDAELSYVVIAPVLVWRDWGLVAVNRPREKGGVEIGGPGNGGAVYLLRRVTGEWRLLSIVRSWGS